jgi:large-conductance mechanosensitive channel
MISFLLEEGVLTVGTLSGLFTTALLNSLKMNIIDPSIESIYPSYANDNDNMEQPPPLPTKKQTNGTSGTSGTSEPGESKSGFGDLFPIPHGPPPPRTGKNLVRWKTFLKDFITWLVIMFCLYIFWKKILHPLKNSN